MAIFPHAYRSARQSLTLSAALLTMLLCLPRTGGAAQAPLATVRGTVQDRAGAPIPGTMVTAKNLETGRSRTASSNAEGQFEILQLAPGSFEFQASRAGFGAKTQEELELAAGQLVILDFVLEPSPEFPSATTVDLISEDQLVGLPLNGRSYSQLATLQAGVSDPSAGSGARGIGGGSLTVAGGRSTSNTFLLDGTNIMDISNRVPRSAAGVQLGSDAVLQVQVFSANYGAEYGRDSGGVLNSITRSGTDEFHGTFFEFFRNSKLDARNFFDDGPEPPPFKRNQFGFTLAGPVVKGRTYFLGSFEAMRDRLTETDISFLPDAEARLGIITNADGTVRNECVDESARPFCVHQKVRPYLELYPLPNSVRRGRGIGENASPQFLPTDENFFTVRLDHKISGRDSFFARYTFDDASSVSGGSIFLFRQRSQSRQQYLTLVETHIFSPTALNSLRFGYTRPGTAIENLSDIEIPRDLFFIPDAVDFGMILIPGLSDFGPEDSVPSAGLLNSFQFADDLVLQRGGHALKIGFETHRYRLDTFTSKFKWGVWSFNSLESFLQAGPEKTTNLTVALPPSDNTTAYRQTLLGVYVQDNYRASPRLQLNLGLRYEFTTRIHDKDGKTSSLRDPLRDRAAQVGPLFKNNPSLLSFSPRLGVAWSPWRGRDTLLRAGFGIYYDQILQYMVSRIKNAVPFHNVVVAANISTRESEGKFLDAAAATAGIVPSTRTLDYEHTTLPTVLRYNFTLQQPLPGGWRLRASYVGARGNHLFRGYEANLFPVPETRADGSLFFPPQCPPPDQPPLPDCRPYAGPINPAFESIEIDSSDAQSFYNSFQLSANKSFSRGVSLRASYTYSKSVDDASQIVPGSPQYGLMRTLDRGLSNFDIRHRLAINYFLTLPWGRGQRWWKSGVLSHVFGGWRLGGILRFRTGTPFTPKINVRTPGYLFAANRPNLLPGRSKNPVEGVTAGCGPEDPVTGRKPVEPGRKLGGPDLYFDPCAYEVPPLGAMGNAGRNTIIAPSVFNMDVSLQREFLLDGKRRLQFRAEFFNLPNHPSFTGSSRGSAIVFSGTSGRLNSRAGRIGRTATTARQVQFALRFSF